MMILFAIVAVLGALNVLKFTREGIMSGLFSVLVYGYFFVVTSSLYDMFKGEHERGITTQYKQQGP
jgi:hypothetical protein